jgi:cation diffusion facilitator family transporter
MAKAATSYNRVLKVTLQGMAVNAVLGVVKLTAGWLTASGALVADGFHSLSDLASDLLVLWGASVARRPEDTDHPYGHGRVETLAGGLVGLMLIILSAVIAWEAVSALRAAHHEVPSWWALLVAGGSFVAKEVLFRITVSAGKAEGSIAALANAWHHRSDALSSLAVLAGIALARLGWPGGDPVAALAVGALILWVGASLSFQAGRDLVDTAVEPQIVARIRQEAEATKGVVSTHKVRARSMGNRVLADLHVQVEATLTVEEGHDIATDVARNIQNKLPQVAHALVHLEPWREEDFDSPPQGPSSTPS